MMIFKILFLIIFSLISISAEASIDCGDTLENQKLYSAGVNDALTDKDPIDGALECYYLGYEDGIKHKDDYQDDDPSIIFESSELLLGSSESSEDDDVDNAEVFQKK